MKEPRYMENILQTVPASTLPSQKLDATERNRLNQLEPIIERGMTSFVEVGTALLEISDRRLYRETHSTFAEYCKAKWRMSARHAYRLCESAEVVNALPENVTHGSQMNERQARELAKVEPERRTEVLQAAASTGTLTAASIRLVAASITVGNSDDVVMTPRDVALDVVHHFRPSGLILDPCRGSGAFADAMPGSDWCELAEGRDFYNWRKPVDWIISNPPYSIFADFLRHSFTVAEHIVYLIPVNKVFNSDRIMREIWTWGGVPEIYVVGGGAALDFPIGFCIGAVHFQRNYAGPINVTFRAGRATP